MKRVIVLGCGLVGKVIAADLAEQYEVTVADINTDNLEALASRHKVNTATEQEKQMK